jgi:hypothetical protein
MDLQSRSVSDLGREVGTRGLASRSKWFHRLVAPNGCGAPTGKPPRQSGKRLALSLAPRRLSHPGLAHWQPSGRCGNVWQLVRGGL